MKAIFPFLFFFLSLFAKGQIVPTRAEERLKGFERKKILQQNSPLNNVIFRSIGPSIMGGRIVDIAVNDSNSIEFFVAYATGGVWYTTNNGQSFTPIFDSNYVISIGAIAVNWKAKAIWVGTGEANGNSNDTRAGLGVYKSDDFGKTWQYKGLPESHCIGKIQLLPTNDNIAWVAVLGHSRSPNGERGVYKTTDGGRTWKHVLYVDENTGAIDLAINPKDSKELYASMWYRKRNPWSYEKGGKSSGIYKSIDNGATWSFISTKESGFAADQNIGRIGLAISYTDPNIIYAIVDNLTLIKDTSNRGASKYVRSDFKQLTKDQFLALDDRKLSEFLSYHKVHYDGTLINATYLKKLIRENRLKATDLYNYFADNYDFDDDTGKDYRYISSQIYRSKNSGFSWEKMSTEATYVQGGAYFGKIYVSPINSNKVVSLGLSFSLSYDGGRTTVGAGGKNVHLDQHTLWIDPKNDKHWVVGNDGGCNVTYDDGAHWDRVYSPAVGQFYSVSLDNSRPYKVFGGLQDNGLWYGPSNNIESTGWQMTGDYAFKKLLGNDGIRAVVDTTDSTTVYAGYQLGSYYKFDMTYGYPDVIQKTKKNLPAPLDELGEEPLRFNWETPLVISQHDQDVLYYGANRLLMSTNKGEGFGPVSNDLTNGSKPRGALNTFGTTTTISESPFQMGLIYVGTDDGNIQLTRDGGKNWELISTGSGLPEGLSVSKVVASRYKISRVYATLNGFWYDHFSAYVFKSEDYGRTWRRLGADLPCEPVNVLKEDPKNENILYVGTDGGVYVSFTCGRSFMAWSAGLPKSITVKDIAIQERENEIVLATYGRSLYVAKLDDVQGIAKDPDWLKKNYRIDHN